MVIGNNNADHCHHVLLNNETIFTEVGNSTPCECNITFVLVACRQYGNILDAAQAGAISVVSVVTNVLVSAYAFLSLISWANSTFTWLGDRVGIEELTMEVHSQAQQSTLGNHLSFIFILFYLFEQFF
jgi:hypothetical protein